MTVRLNESAAMGGISVELSESGMSAMVDGLLRVGETVDSPLPATGRPRWCGTNLASSMGSSLLA